MKLKRIIIIGLNLAKISFKLNLFKTIYFNFKVLPFNQALRLPFHFYGRTDFVNLSGEFKIMTPDIHFGMIVFGGKHEIVISSNLPTRIFNSGKIEFNGYAKFARGINIMVWDNGNVSFGENLSIGSLCRIISFRNITFGNKVLISWECQFFDTDFHFIQNTEKVIKDNCGDVTIDDGVWIGNRVAILKNTRISKNTIVASNSLCTGDYAKDGEGILLAGAPAKYIRNNVEYLKDKNQELELFKYFNNYQNTEIIWEN